MITYGSVCSGIEAATLGWEPLGWKASWFAEIEKFPSAVLKHRWPDVPNMGDMNKLPDMIRFGLVSAPDILVGGTPCQAFSVAGLRQGMVDPRGALTIKFVEVANAIDEQRPDRPCTILWENVPGVLSDKENAFGCFLAALVGEEVPLQPPGGRWTNSGYVYGPQRTACWRILDAQYFGVAQRRRRVFVVASAGAVSVEQILFECESVRRDIAPSRKKGEEVAPTIRSGAPNGGPGHGARSGDSKDELIIPVGIDGGDVGFALRAGASHSGDKGDGGMNTTVAVCMSTGQGNAEIGVGVGTTLNCNHEAPIIAYSMITANTGANGLGLGLGLEISPTLDRANGCAVAFKPIGFEANMSESSVSTNDLFHTITRRTFASCTTPSMRVRRLTPQECERLQGMPDDHTAIPGAADGPRYKAIGNSKAVPVVRWIGKRIQEALTR